MSKVFRTGSDLKFKQGHIRRNGQGIFMHDSFLAMPIVQTEREI